MRKLGFTVTEHVGRTGIVALYRNGPGPVVLVRTELDALPLEEKTGLPYASHAQQTVDGRLTYIDHACGHDAHMAWWVGIAAALLAMKDQWHGTLIFVGQPAEEIISGAKAMLADGLYTRFPKPDYAFGAHVSPTPINAVTIKQGTVTSASDTIYVTFHGIGVHGSQPNLGIDPVMEGARFVVDVQSVISPQKFGAGSWHVPGGNGSRIELVAVQRDQMIFGSTPIGASPLSIRPSPTHAPSSVIAPAPGRAAHTIHQIEDPHPALLQPSWIILIFVFDEQPVRRAPLARRKPQKGFGSGIHRQRQRVGAEQSAVAMSEHFQPRHFREPTRQRFSMRPAFVQPGTSLTPWCILLLSITKVRQFHHLSPLWTARAQIAAAG